MNGLLIVNKEKNCTSRDVVNEICKIFNTIKVGHTGTLDPLAEGVLVIALNDSLKKVQFLTNDTKEYIVEVKLGIETDTLDITGNILRQVHYSIDENTIKDVLKTFIGKQIQTTPLYSAVRVNGKRLYEYARENKEVELPKREVEIYSIDFIDLKDDTFKFKTKVSKGTYIRSLVDDISKKLNIPAVMNNLLRTRVGNFCLEDSYTLNDIKDGKYKLIDDDVVFDNYKKISVDSYLGEKILNGSILENRYDENIIVFTNDNRIIGIYEVYKKDNSKIKPIRIFK